MEDLNAYGVSELEKDEKNCVNGGGMIAYYTGYILGKLLSSYGEANPGPRQCPI